MQTSKDAQGHSKDHAVRGARPSSRSVKQVKRPGKKGHGKERKLQPLSTKNSREHTGSTGLQATDRPAEPAANSFTGCY